MNNKKRYIEKYNKSNYKMYQFRVRKDDTKLVKFLDSQKNRTNYILSLIDKDQEHSILTIKQIKEKILPVLSKHKIKDVYLFGEYARGEATKNSDVGIYCDRGDIKTDIKHEQLQNEIENLLKKSVNIIFIGSQMHWFFKQQLEKDLIKLIY